MRFYLLISLLKLELAKYNLGFTFKVFLFAVIFIRLNYKMTSQSTLATYQRNKNANHHETVTHEYICISGNNKSLLKHENETDTDDSTAICCEIKTSMCLDSSRICGIENYAMIKNPKFGTLVLNSYRNERYLRKQLWKSSMSGNRPTFKEYLERQAFSNEKSNSKQIHSKLQIDPESYSRKSNHFSDERSKDKCLENKNWATWKKSESSVSHQPSNSSDNSIRIAKVLVSVGKYCEKEVSVSMKTATNYNECVRGKKQTTFNRNEIVKNLASSIEACMNFISPGTKFESPYFKKENMPRTSNYSVTKWKMPKIETDYKISNRAKFDFDAAVSKLILLNFQDYLDFAKKESGTFTDKCTIESPTTEIESDIFAIEKASTEKKISKLILSIMQDDSNSDLQNLEAEINSYYSSAADLSVSLANFENFPTYWQYNEANSSDEFPAPIPQKVSSGTEWENKKAHSYDESLAQMPEKECSGTHSGSNINQSYDVSLAQIPSKESFNIYGEHNYARSYNESLAQIAGKRSCDTNSESNKAQSCDESLAQIPPNKSSAMDWEHKRANYYDESSAKVPSIESSGTNLESNKAQSYDESLAHIPLNESSGTDLEHDKANCYDESSAKVPFKESSETNSESNKAQSYNESMAQILQNESSSPDFQFTNEKDEKLEILEGSYPATKRTRGNSVDSGICLDSNFEGVLPETSVQESNFSEENLSNVKKDVLNESTSDWNRGDPSKVDDSLRTCQICNQVILSFFLSNRFGLLLNCWHSFCYSCIRNQSKSKRLCTNNVVCPKCGKNSPGVVPSRHWIKDSNEKTILFEEYEKECKFFNKQQQVFLKFVSSLE